MPAPTSNRLDSRDAVAVRPGAAADGGSPVQQATTAARRPRQFTREMQRCLTCQDEIDRSTQVLSVATALTCRGAER